MIIIIAMIVIDSLCFVIVVVFVEGHRSCCYRYCFRQLHDPSDASAIEGIITILGI